MTEDPMRLLQDPGLNPGLDELLRSAPMPLDLPDAVAARVGATLEQLAGPAGTPEFGAPSDAPAPSTAASRSGVFKWLAGKPVLVVGGVALSAALAGFLARQTSSNQPANGIAAGSARTAPERVTEGAMPTALPHAIPAADVATTLVPSVGPELGTADNGSTVKDSSAARLPSSNAPSASARAVPNSTLAREARLLESIRATIEADPVRARRKLAEYDAQFPNGALLQERALLAVRLAVAEGRRGEAQIRASEIEQSGTASPYTKKARELVNSSERAATSRTNTK